MIDVYASCGSYLKSFAVNDYDPDVKVLLIKKFPEAPYEDLAILINAIKELMTNPGYPAAQFFKDIQYLQLPDEEMENYPALKEKEEEERLDVDREEERHEEDESEK